MNIFNGPVSIRMNHHLHQHPSTNQGDRLAEARQWFKNNDLTRRETWEDGTIIYYLNSQPHRTDGPAVIYQDGCTEYWINGVRWELHDLQRHLALLERQRPDQ